jgi:penicillin amidase
MRKTFKWISVALLALLVLALGAVLLVRNRMLPTMSGNLTLSGLNAPVEIIRDTAGVPHIYAKSIDDAHFALGYTHAQERFWQMEFQRRIANGRVAELVGPPGLDTDKFLRTLGVAQRAKVALTEYDADSLRALQHYADGVNAWLAEGHTTPEMMILGAPKPEPWMPADTVAWSIMMAWDLGANWNQELLRMRMAAFMDKAQIDRLILPYPGDAPLETADYVKLYRSLGLDKPAGVAPTAMADLPPFLGRDSGNRDLGSNNWVVNGSRSESGKPLLSNDPHLSFLTPSLWYLVHLNAPGLDVIGASLPGVPYVVLGRTPEVAWGFTNTGPDVQDMYLERVNPADANQYQTPDGFSPFVIRTETLRVKGAADVVMTVRETRHGPVVSEVLGQAVKALAGHRDYVLAFRWTALLAGDKTLQAGLKMNQAHSLEQLRAALRDFHAPQQNIVYADTQGNIGFIAAGRVPVRKPENDLKGVAPAPGWDARYDWAGWLAYEDLPQTVNPAKGWIATANEKITPPGYPHYLQSDWAQPYRAQRIRQLLEATPKHSVQSFAAMQTDRLSLGQLEMKTLLAKTAPTTERERQAMAMLNAWNGDMDPDRPEPAIMVAWWREMLRQIFADELAPVWPDAWIQQNLHYTMLAALRRENGQEQWCDDVRTKDVVETCDMVAQIALKAALDTLVKETGSEDMRAWRWGALHAVQGEHRPFGKHPLLSKLFDTRIEVGGDRFSVNQTGNNVRDEPRQFATHHGASYRAIYDLAKLDGGSFVQSTGQSGNLLSGHYRDYAKLWGQGERVPMLMSRDAVTANTSTTLVLNPP